MRRSLQVSLIALFAALHAVLYFMSFGLWRNWAIYLETIEAIILGPFAGFLTALIGGGIARAVSADVFWMFGLAAESVSVLLAGFLVSGRWKPVLAAYVIMLLAYFSDPIGRQLPLWTILDVLLACFLIVPAAKLGRNLTEGNVKRLSLSLLLVSFVCVATDSLVRIFMLVPAGLHRLFQDFFGTFEYLSMAFIEGAAASYIEDVIAAVVAIVVGVPLWLAITKLNILDKVRIKGTEGSSVEQRSENDNS